MTALATSEIPHLKLYILVRNFLNIAADGWLGCDRLAKVAKLALASTSGTELWSCRHWPTRGSGS